MSLYSEYIRERLGYETVECDYGFATYQYVESDKVYIVDIYIKPEKRRSKLASQLANLICDQAKKDGKKYVIGSADSRARGYESSLKTLEGYGMKVYKVHGSTVYYIKEIEVSNG